MYENIKNDEVIQTIVDKTFRTTSGYYEQLVEN